MWIVTASLRKVRPCSRLFLYFNARMLNGKRAGNGRLLDQGTSLRACCKAVAHFGVAPEQLFPYQERLVSVQPPLGGSGTSRMWTG